MNPALDLDRKATFILHTRIVISRKTGSKNQLSRSSWSRVLTLHFDLLSLSVSIGMKMFFYLTVIFVTTFAVDGLNSNSSSS